MLDRVCRVNQARCGECQMRGRPRKKWVEWHPKWKDTAPNTSPESRRMRSFGRIVWLAITGVLLVDQNSWWTTGIREGNGSSSLHFEKTTAALLNFDMIVYYWVLLPNGDSLFSFILKHPVAIAQTFVVILSSKSAAWNSEAYVPGDNFLFNSFTALFSNPMVMLTIKALCPRMCN